MKLAARPLVQTNISAANDAFTTFVHKKQKHAARKAPAPNTLHKTLGMYLVFPVHCPRVGVCERGKIAEDKCQNRNFSTYLGGEKTARRKEADEAQKACWFIGQWCGGAASRREGGELFSLCDFDSGNMFAAAWWWIGPASSESLISLFARPHKQQTHTLTYVGGGGGALGACVHNRGKNACTFNILPAHSAMTNEPHELMLFPDANLSGKCADESVLLWALSARNNVCSFFNPYGRISGKTPNMQCKRTNGNESDLYSLNYLNHATYRG